MPSKIEDYALLGDCETAALVGLDGSVDWLCWPRFDSGACFAALLGGPENGRWIIAPRKAVKRIMRRYRDDTLILETDIETAEGEVTLIEFMPPRGKASDLVRLVLGKRGKVTMRTELIIRFDYGSVVPWVTQRKDRTLCAVSGPDMVVLRTSMLLRGEGRKTIGEFTVSAGDTVSFVLTYGPSYLPVPAPIDPMAALADTEAFWRDWSSRFHGAGDWSAPVLRSLITLKALTYRPTGGMVAAATTSLPELFGGERNWDYRFCWLRDATFTLYALIGAGFLDEAKAWRDWLLRAIAGSPEDLRIMYGVAGERRLPEYEVPSLRGYEGAGPVRIGNAAAEQLQLDVYGEVLDAFYVGRAAGLPAEAATWALECALLRHLETIWNQPDDGLWEVRGGRRHFTHSKVMAWVAFDRAVRSVEEFGLSGPVDHWRMIRNSIHKQVCERGFDPAQNAFVQSYGVTALDASLLLIPMVGFLPATDPRVRGTVAAIERNLMSNGFVRRYDTQKGTDGLPPGEGAFLACSFWLADNYVLQGRHADALELFNRLLPLRNDVGLLAEEYDASAKRQSGNFPQAFSHLALINTAHNLLSARGPAHQRAASGEVMKAN
ncbi:glycoside hydrolase family 15 protein [Methyloferula stellata]|uniref:glycoside hydrolase family 15 protein n=1 Tax=Methyloferula stellata TaxID=876270 RepID=UPI0003664A27|nr:glycoside hydrolase family 15 protein [Methyloferula stellata]